MNTEAYKTAKSNDLKLSISNNDEIYRLERLLEIFIEVDKNLKKQSNELNNNK